MSYGVDAKGPLTRTELDALRALCEHHKEKSLFARETRRLIGMIDARDAVIRELMTTSDATAEGTLRKWLDDEYQKSVST